MRRRSLVWMMVVWSSLSSWSGAGHATGTEQKSLAELLAPYKGKVVLLDFWASWCGPCRQSFPWMDDLQNRYRNDGLVVVAVNVDQERKLAEEFLAATRPKFRVEYDPAGNLATQLEVTSMPSSFVVDRAGRIRQRHIGFKSAQRDSREQALAQLLQERP